MFIKVFFTHMYGYEPHIFLMHAEVREGINLLDLEFWVVVNHLGGTRNPVWVLCKSNRRL